MNLICIHLKKMLYVYANRLRRTRPGVCGIQSCDLSAIAQRATAGSLSVAWKKQLLIITIACLALTDAVQSMERRQNVLDPAYRGNICIVRERIASGADVNFQDYNAGYTALMLAVNFGHSDVAQELLDAQADVNIQSKMGFTALMLAAKHGDLPLVKKLIAKGADANLKTIKNETALTWAKKHNQQKVVQYLESLCE